MPLILTLSHASGGAGTPERVTLNEGSLTIGRAPGNGWVLADPQRHLSRTHCVIAYADGGYVLTDLSANGVFLNGAAEPLTADRPAVLADGDEIRLGDYVIAVAETAAPRSATSEIPVGTPAGNAAPGNAAPGVGAPAGVPPADSLAGLYAPPPADSLAGLYAAPRGPAFAHPIAALPALREDDPFDRADEMRAGDRAAVEDLFKGFEPLEVWQGPSQPDNADAPVHAVAEPRFVAAPRFDELDIDALLGDVPPGQPVAAGGVVREALPMPDEAPSQRALPMAGMPWVPGGMPGPGPEPGPGSALPSSPLPSSPLPSSAGSPPSAGPPVATTASGADAARLLAAFLEGAGVPALRLPPGSDPAAVLRDAGAVFRVMVEGLREVLMSRAAVKHEFRAEQTMLGPSENNPLKFSVTAADAVAALLEPGRQGYQRPLEATRQAFADLKSHELAVMAGVQTALTGLLQRINPAALEDRQRAGSGCGLLPAARKARCWELFRATYKEIARDAEGDFQSAFGRDFARAYEAQVRHL